MSFNCRNCVLAAWLLLGVAGARAQEATLSANTNRPIRQVGPGLFEVGQVRLDTRLKTASFAGRVNQREGAIEYLLVAANGKLLESVLRTDIEPYHLHTALLLLGVKGAPPTTLNPDYSRPVAGDPISLSVVWTNQNQRLEFPAEDLVSNVESGQALTRGNWTYSGSRLLEGTFIAQRDRSVVAVMGDMDALINNPRPGRENDKIWTVNTKACPPLETPVWITVKWLGKPANKE
jgi:hypothetical protein